MQEPFPPVLRVCWLEGGRAAEAQHYCHTAAGPSRVVCSPIRARRARGTLSAASSPDVASGITNLSFFFFYFTPWSLVLCINDHHLTGSINVIQLVL